MATDQSAAPPPQETPRKSRFGTWVQKRFMPVEEISQHARLTTRMFSAITGTEKNQRNETFEEAVTRQNLTAEDLLGSYKRQRMITIIMLGMIALAFFYVALLTINASSFADYFVAIMAFGPVSVLGAVALRASFRAWQIRHKRLGGFDEFMANTKEWWPKKITVDHFQGLQSTAVKKAKKPKARQKPASKVSSTA